MRIILLSRYLFVLFFSMTVVLSNDSQALGQAYIELPILNKSGMFVVSAKVNGNITDLYLDTGSTSSVIESKRLAEFNILANTALTETNGVVVGSDQASYIPINISELCLGPLHYYDVAAVAMSLDDINQNSPDPLSGILGQDILLKNQAMIAFHSSVLLLPSSEGKRLEIIDKQAIKLHKLNNGLFVLPITLNNKKVDLILDSGAPDIILDSTLLKASVKTKVDIVESALSETQTAAGQAVNNVKIESVRLGTYDLMRSTIMTTNLSHITSWLAQQENINVSGTFGLKALKELNAILDISNAILYVDRLNTSSVTK